MKNSNGIVWEFIVRYVHSGVTDRQLQKFMEIPYYQNAILDVLISDEYKDELDRLRTHIEVYRKGASKIVLPDL